jgi:hypothetical protein
VIDNGCGGNNGAETCFVSGTAGGLGTTVYTVSMTAEGVVAPYGSGASGSVTLNDVGMVSGAGTGYIEFFDYSVAPYGPYGPSDVLLSSIVSFGPL